MTTLLRIDSSARTSRSLTRELADTFVSAWRSRIPDTQVILRDVGATPPPAISEAWVAAAFAGAERSAEQRALLELSDELIDEIELADIIIIATPMYNYGMPAALKAWFDQVVRIDRTFSFDLSRGDRPLEPILSGKTLIILTSSGEFGFSAGGFNDGAGHLVPHIRTCSKYLGVERIEHVGVEYQEFGDSRFDASRAAAIKASAELALQMISSPQSGSFRPIVSGRQPASLSHQAS